MLLASGTKTTYAISRSVRLAVFFFVSDERMQAMISKRCSEREQMCFSRINPKYGPTKADC